MLKYKVGQVMSSHELVSLLPTDTVDFARGVSDDFGINHLLVMQDGLLLGVVCICDFDGARVGATMAECIQRRPTTTGPWALIEDAVEIMNEASIGCLPVMVGQDVVGMLTRSDLRRSGIDSDLLGPDPHCVCCGTRRHVRAHDTMQEVGMCLDCRQRSEPPHWTEDLGRGS